MAQEYRKLTREELNELAGEELPEQVVLSLVNADLAVPVDGPAVTDEGADAGRSGG